VPPFDFSLPLGPDVTINVLDLAAFAWFGMAWFFYSEISHRHHVSHTSENLLSIMHQYRVQWMRQMLKRESRIPDMTGVGNLIRSVSFFGSTSIFLVLGSIGLLGYSEQAQGVIRAIPYAVPPSPFVWELKVALLIIVFVHAFFKYTWSLRLFNYLTIYVGAAPGTHEHLEQHEAYAQRGAEMMTTAARHFNLGLRAYYYGFAIISWFFHPLAFIITTTVVIWVLYRREFLSGTYFTLKRDDPVLLRKTTAA
jgi:uncharacterized membrane protein